MLQTYLNAFKGFSKELWFLCLITFINRAGAMVLPFMTLFFTQNKGYTFIEAGYLMSAFGAGSLTGAYIGGWLTDRIGYYPVIYSSLFGGGLLFFLIPFMPDFWSLFVLIYFLSTVLDSMRPANATAITLYSKPENLTRAVSLYRLAINLGFSAGPAMGGTVAFLYGYNTLFVIDGVTCILAGLLFMALLPQKNNAHKAENSIQNRTPEERRTYSAYRNPHFLWMLLAKLLFALGFMQFFSTFSVFMKQDYGMNEREIGLLMALNGILIVIVEMPLVAGLERRFKALPLIAFAAVLQGLGFGLFNWFPVLGIVAIACIVLTTFSEMIASPFGNAYALQLAQPWNRGQYMGLYQATYSASHLIAPLVGFWIADQFDFGTLWWLVLMLSFVSAAIFWVLGKRE